MWSIRKNKNSNIVVTPLVESHSGNGEEQRGATAQRGAGGCGLAPSPTARIIPRVFFFLRTHAIRYAVNFVLQEETISVVSNINLIQDLIDF